MSDLGLGLTIGLRDAFSAEARRISESADSLDKRIGAAAAGVTESMRQMAGGIQDGLARIRTGGILMGVGAAFAAVPTAMVMATNETQKALAEFSSLGQADLLGLERAAERFTNRWSGYNKAEFVGAAYQIRSALSDLNQAAIETATGVAALTAKATLGGLAQTADTMVAAYANMRSLNRELSDQQWFEAFSGAMSKTVQQFRTTGPEIGMALRNLGAVATSAGVQLAEQMAILGQLQASMPGEMAGTIYRGFIMKAAEAGRALGLDFLNAQGHLRGIQEIVGALRGRFPDLADQAAQVQIKEAFGSDEAVKFILAMTDGFDRLGPGIAAVEQGFREGLTVTQQMARLVDNHLGASLSRIGQVFRNTMEAVGRSVLPWVRPVVDAIASAAEAVTGFMSAHEGLSRAVMGGVAALGGLLFVGGTVLVLVGTLGLAVVAFKTAVAGLATISITGFAATAAALWPVYVGVAAVAGVALALRAAWSYNFLGMADAVRAFVAGAWAPFRAGLVTAWHTLLDAVAPLGDAFRVVAAEVAGLSREFTGLASGPSPEIFHQTGNAVGALASGLARLSATVASGNLKPLVYVVGLLASGLVNLAEGFMRPIRAGLWFANLMMELPRTTLATWRYFSHALGTALAPVAEVWRESLLPAVQAVMGAFRELFGMNATLDLSPLRAVLGAVLTPLRWVIEGVALLARGLGLVLGGVVSSVVVPTLRAVTTVLGWLKSGVEAVAAAVRDTFDLLKSVPLLGRFFEWSIAEPQGLPAMRAPEPAPGLVPQMPATPQVEIISPEVRPRMVMPAMRPMMAAGLAAMSAVPQMPTPLPTGLMPPPATVVRVESPAPAQRPFGPVFQPVRTTPQQVVVMPAARQDNRDIIEAIERLARQPIEVQSQINLDGRRIGQAVARHNRDESVKEMG